MQLPRLRKKGRRVRHDNESGMVVQDMKYLGTMCSYKRGRLMLFYKQTMCAPMGYGINMAFHANMQLLRLLSMGKIHLTVSKWFKNKIYMKAYEFVVNLVKGREFWPSREEGSLLTPMFRRMPSQFVKKRIMEPLKGRNKG